MLDNSLVNQGNAGLQRFSSTPSTQPYSGTGISSVANASPGTSGQQNGSSLTNSYLNALKTQQGATAAAQSLSGYTAPDPNAPTPALPQFTPEQQKQFQTMLGMLPTMGTPGLNTVMPAPTATTTMAGDNSRFTNDPFKTNVNALR